ncbi:methionine adenosyltransferase [Pseudoclavibacter caeni]|jgi:S-adenosylmethionine synthetase|uniref:S-adenosylmethionine synthase n=1 Tax=Pseudoclavibacter caeni TaxID=908846 RepID=A0A7C8BPA8_9MICO|nr:methionine adenosyltransferase [Pseudoclavibacter caeni]KAB1632914.1 methionine adenosyltransferase [Pseudoclavibacter caeni]NYJ97119.1 S-adenosylmethionine synthetase [Pseudoclavibacter caeni]
MSDSELRLVSSESVTEGHPDKICDQVSDAILDALLAVDPHALTAVETVATRGLVHVVGEIKTEGYVEIPQIVRDVITGIGYTSSEVGFDGRSCGVSLSIGQQSAEIRDGVLTSYEARELGSTDPFDQQGAGDQGIMFGYATNETPEYMPAPIAMAHRLTRRLAGLRHSGELPWLRPDGKAQVTIGFDGATPRTVDTVVVSTQHDPERTNEEIREAVRRLVIDPVVAASGLDASGMKTFINPSGRFTEGGPGSDAGLTGRKIIVDTYGGAAHHGGGAFSGKDPSKVDRSAAYALRYAAKNAVAAGLADRLEIQVAYAIGKARPVGLYADSFGTGRLGSDQRIAEVLQQVFDLRPEAILERLDLRRPIYQRTAAYGHFGRDEPGFTWEALDRVDEVRAAAGL